MTLKESLISLKENSKTRNVISLAYQIIEPRVSIFEKMIGNKFSSNKSERCNVTMKILHNMNYAHKFTSSI